MTSENLSMTSENLSMTSENLSMTSENLSRTSVQRRLLAEIFGAHDKRDVSVDLTILLHSIM